MLGYLELAGSTAMYGAGLVAQSVVARSAERRPGAGLGLLGRLATDRLYLAGLTSQAGGFTLAFLARATLPLYLVQAGATCSIGLATVFGMLVLRWRVRPAELAVLVVMASGLALLAAAATPSVAHDLPPELVLALFALLLLIGLAAGRAARLAAPLSSAVLAGLAFAVVAIASRALADKNLLTLPLQPLAWLMVLAAVLGQSCLAIALTCGSVASIGATMDATTMVLTSVVGIALLGDRIVACREWLVVLGLALVLVAALALGRMSALTSVVTARREAV